jgi:hypothetical protein
VAFATTKKTNETTRFHKIDTRKLINRDIQEGQDKRTADRCIQGLIIPETIHE